MITLHIAHCWLRHSVEFLTLQPAGPTKGGEVVPRASIRRETIISPGSLFHLPPLLHSSRLTLLPVLFLKYANHRAVLLLCAILNIGIALHGTLQYIHYSSTRPALKCTLIIFSVQVYHLLLSSVQYAIISITKTSIVRQENCQFSVTWCSFFSQPNMFFNINKI